MPKNDELLFGTDSTVTRDRDGDGVSDVQERLDGTDPDDATDHTTTAPVLNPRDIDDPRGDLRHVDLGRETIVDVKGTAPVGHTVEQTLPKGLDGKDISTGARHYGNDQADQFMVGRSGDATSPVNMTRDPHIAGLATTPAKGHDATKDTLGRNPGPGAGGDNANFSQGHHDGPPPGQTPSGSADPTNNMDLVSDRVIPQAKDRTADQRGQTPSKTGADTTPKELKGKDYDKQKDATPAPPEKGVIDTAADAVKSFFGFGKKDVDPDADTGTGTPTAEAVERAIVVHGAATDTVEGHGGGPQIESTAPPKMPRDLVTDPGDGDTDSTSGATTVVTPPHQDISHPVNPNPNIGGGQDPSGGAGGGGGGGQTGQGDGRMGASFAATAATADPTTDPATDSIADSATDHDNTNTTDDTTNRDASTSGHAADDSGQRGNTTESTDTTTDTTPIAVVDGGATHAIHTVADEDGSAPPEMGTPIVGEAASRSSGGPVRDITLDTDDPRGDLLQIDLTRESPVDVAAMMPTGHSLDQTLPTGLDGNTIPTGPRHYGNDQADALLTGRGADANSPASMQRDPHIPGLDSSPSDGRDPTTETFGQAGPGNGDVDAFGQTHQDGPPPGQTPSGSADPTDNRDLVSKGGGAHGFKMVEVPRETRAAAPRHDPAPAPDAGTTTAPTTTAPTTTAPTAADAGTSAPVVGIKQFVFDPDAAAGTTAPEGGSSGFQKALDRAGGNKSTDPDATDDAGVPTEEAVARAIVVHGAATDVVEGHGGTQIVGDAPAKSARDLVTDPGDGDTDSTSGATTVVTPPHQDISHPVNPNTNLGGGQDPHGGAGGSDGGQGDGRMGSSAAATAAQAPSDDPASPADGSTADESGDNSTHAGVDASSLPVDPIADAMAATPDAPDAGNPEPFANLEIDAALAIPAEADLDDGF